MSLHSELQTLGGAVNALLQVLGGQNTAQPSTPAPSAPSPAARPSYVPSVARSTTATSGTVSVNQEQLLQLVNIARRFIRYSREGNIPSKEQRKYGRRAIKAVKHHLPTREAVRSF